MIEIRTELAEIIRFEQPLAHRRLPAVHSDQVHTYPLIFRIMILHLEAMMIRPS